MTAPAQTQPASAPEDPPTSEAEIRINSVSGSLRLFVGAELGEPASRSIGRSPEWLTLRCEGHGAENHCVGTTTGKGEFWPDDCLILALDSHEQEMILSGDLLCRKLDPLYKWKLLLDFAQGTALAQDLNRPRAAGPDTVAGASSSTQGSKAPKGVSLMPERFNRRVFDARQRKQ